MAYEDNPYQDGEPSGPPANQDPGQMEEKKEGEQTELLNSSICPGMKVGEELVLKIVGVHDKEYEVAYAPKEEKEPDEPGEGPPVGDAEMASMME